MRQKKLNWASLYRYWSWFSAVALNLCTSPAELELPTRHLRRNTSKVFITRSCESCGRPGGHYYSIVNELAPSLPKCPRSKHYIEARERLWSRAKFDSDNVGSEALHIFHKYHVRCFTAIIQAHRFPLEPQAVYWKLRLIHLTSTHPHFKNSTDPSRRAEFWVRRTSYII